MSMLRSRKAFTLVEIMIVVAIIGLLAAIAIPNFVRARETALKNACIANLKQIEGAVAVWAIDNAESTNAPSDTNDLVPTYMRAWPQCGGTDYEIPNSLNDTPVCPVNGVGHALPS